jgi:hypothetical protein
VPEIVPKHWWEHLLHNKTGLYIRTAFLFRPNVVVITVPFLLGSAVRVWDLMSHDGMLEERDGGGDEGGEGESEEPEEPTAAAATGAGPRP